MYKKAYGFTIVELLVVIVIIAILAAITIVAFNGATARAQVDAQKTAINSIDKKAKLKAVLSGSILPSSSTTTTAISEWDIASLSGKLYSSNDETSNRNKGHIYFNTWQEDGIEYIDLYWWNAQKSSWMQSTITNTGRYQNIPGTPVTVGDIPYIG